MKKNKVDFVESFNRIKRQSKVNKILADLPAIGSICISEGCERRSTCGDYCYTHCNCNKDHKQST